METFHEPTNYNGTFTHIQEETLVKNIHFATECHLKDTEENSVMRVKCHRKNTCAGQDLSQSTSRIAGGFEVLPGSNPYTVALFKNGYQMCGGSIITNKWVKFLFIASINTNQSINNRKLCINL